jgi:hypothetical protein
VACTAVPYFPHYLRRGTIFGRKTFLCIKYVCAVFPQNLYEKFLILRGSHGDIMRDIHRDLCKVQVMLIGF